MAFLITLTKGAKKVMKGNSELMDHETIDSKLYSISEISEAIDLDHAYVLALSRKGAFKYLVVDGRIKITESELEKLKVFMSFVNHLVKVLNEEKVIIALKSRKEN